MGIEAIVLKAYVFFEDLHCGAMDFLQKLGFPAYAYVEAVESRGLPSLIFTLFIIFVAMLAAYLMF